jgi:hypothetical protein
MHSLYLLFACQHTLSRIQLLFQVRSVLNSSTVDIFSILTYGHLLRRSLVEMNFQ